MLKSYLEKTKFKIIKGLQGDLGPIGIPTYNLDNSKFETLNKVRTSKKFKFTTK